VLNFSDFVVLSDFDEKNEPAGLFLVKNTSKLPQM
jgi:hypothetical protein